jgi:Mg2+ and Co2+ transporter CorA
VEIGRCANWQHRLVMIIDCAYFVAGRDVEAISLGDAGRRAGEGAGFVWVALSDPVTEDLDALSPAFDLPSYAVQDTPAGYQRPKLERHGETTILTVTTVHHDEAGAQLELGAVHILVGARHAIAIGQSSPGALRGASERLRVTSRRRHARSHGGGMGRARRGDRRQRTRRRRGR